MIYLTKIDPAKNMSRFYALDVQPTLFGDWSLVKEWGRIGREGRTRMVSFGDKGAADAALGRELKRREKRGYGRLAQDYAHWPDRCKMQE